MSTDVLKAKRTKSTILRNKVNQMTLRREAIFDLLNEGQKNDFDVISRSIINNDKYHAAEKLIFLTGPDTEDERLIQSYLAGLEAYEAQELNERELVKIEAKLAVQLAAALPAFRQKYFIEEVEQKRIKPAVEKTAEVGRETSEWTEKKNAALDAMRRLKAWLAEWQGALKIREDLWADYYKQKIDLQKDTTISILARYYLVSSRIKEKVAGDLHKEYIEWLDVGIDGFATLLSK